MCKSLFCPINKHPTTAHGGQATALAIRRAVCTSEHFGPASKFRTPHWRLNRASDKRWGFKNTELPERHSNAAVIFFLFGVLCHVVCRRTFVLVSATKLTASTFVFVGINNPLSHGVQSEFVASPSQLLNGNCALQSLHMSAIVVPYPLINKTLVHASECFELRSEC